MGLTARAGTYGYSLPATVLDPWLPPALHERWLKRVPLCASAYFGDWLQPGRRGRHGRQWQVAAGLIYGQVKKS
jgi:hypothetical protein